MFILYDFIQLLSVYPIIQIVNSVVVNSLSPCDRFKIKICISLMLFLSMILEDHFVLLFRPYSYLVSLIMISFADINVKKL